MKTVLRDCRVYRFQSDKKEAEIGDIVCRYSDGRIALVNPLTVEDPNRGKHYVHDLFVVDPKLSIRKGDLIVCSMYPMSVFTSDQDYKSHMTHLHRVIGSTKKMLNVGELPEKFVEEYVQKQGFEDCIVEYEEGFHTELDLTTNSKTILPKNKGRELVIGTHTDHTLVEVTFTKAELRHIRSDVNQRIRYAPEENTAEEESLAASILKKISNIVNL